MPNLIQKAESDEDWRREAFPACRDRIFMAHAAVTAIPQAAVDAMEDFNRKSATGELDYSKVLLKDMDTVRVSAAKIIESDADEVALLGPTSLGLSLVANGLEWSPGDEIVTYLDDYPANVYPRPSSAEMTCTTTGTVWGGWRSCPRRGTSASWSCCSYRAA